LTTNERNEMTGRRLAPIHPGETLEEEFMRPLGLSANGLAKAVGVSVTRISEIVRGRRGVTADTALRLGRFFGTSPELWLGLQSEYDLRVARRDFGELIESHVLPLKRAGLRYEGDKRIGAGSEVREAVSRYAANRAVRTRDRRRNRRSS
jgi:addiction module HigA family antidote